MGEGVSMPDEVAPPKGEDTLRADWLSRGRAGEVYSFLYVGGGELTC